MDRLELKQLRKMFFMDVVDAAKFIGDCEPRTWQRWEKGDREVPLDVIETMQHLAATRQSMLDRDFDKDDPMYTYFEEYSDFKKLTGAHYIKWRLAQSVAAGLACEKHAKICNDNDIIDDH